MTDEDGEDGPRLYAYWALRQIAPEHAASFREMLRQDHRPIETMSGCVSWSECVYKLAESLD